MKKLMNQWKQYKYRFVPWLAFNLKDRNIRSVTKNDTDIILTPVQFQDFLHQFLFKLNQNYENLQPLTPGSQKYHEIGQKILFETSGFCIERTDSLVQAAGRGVKVTQGTIPQGAVTSLYCGLVYESFEPIFFQSIKNQFIFRCTDGTLIDGNDRGLSKYLFRSCRGRDSCWPLPSCDDTWLTPYPSSPINVGQYVNNQSKQYPANVAYQEFFLPESFPARLRQYLPNNHYTASSSVPEGFNRFLKIVALVSLREISCGEELFSSYFTVVR